MAQLITYDQLNSIVAAYVDKNKIALNSFNITRDNMVGLVDKIAEIFTLDTAYIDKLAMLDGFDLSFGRTLEEWQQDLQIVEAYDSEGANALAPNDPEYRTPYYSYTLGKKVIATTVRYNDIERAVHFAAQFDRIVAMITKRLYDSEAVFKYGAKRQMIGDVIDMACGVSASGIVKVYAASTAYDKGVYLYDATTKKHYSMLKSCTAAQNTSIANLLSGNYIIESEIVETGVTEVTDEDSGEDFIELVKKAVEKASDISQGCSFSGNCLGATTDGLVLFIKQGVTPTLDVKTMAGAFNLDKVAIPAEIVAVPDFGTVSSTVGAGAFAVLADKRSLRLHNSYRAVREQENGKGNFMNLFLHLEYTAFISMNTFFKVFTTASF